ncbi:hypothetical protein FGO68_gene17554 [Halteria grandinella]|uniref:ENTH domain-containing protein n=1 Tax=Halteria grandinella TaxID=5974 RepID=A0A8J8NVF6_HALGN|nr:hypothetical protein FGO68_gene17554 [Halteria grandinella]
MFDTVKDYAFSMKEKVKETVVSYTARSEIDKVLIEATANENWNVPNSKLQILADAAYQNTDYQAIMTHLRAKLDVPAYEWRRILKSLTAVEYILKNGPPRVASDVRSDMMFKLQGLMSFSYHEDNVDKGHSIRDKAILLQDLVTQPQRLEVEREQAKQYRDKFYPGSAASQYGNTTGSGTYGKSAGAYDSYGGGNVTSMGSQGSSSGYGGYDTTAVKDAGVSVMGVAAQGVGLIASGVANTVMGGISYLKGGEANANNNSKMMGFGSDSLSSQGGGNYAPPGGYSGISAGGYSGEATYSGTGLKTGGTSNNSYGNTKWGAPTQPKIDEKKPTAPASGSQEKKKKRKDRKKSSSEESSSSGEEQKKPAKKKEEKTKEEINLLELDAPKPPVPSSNGFDFMNSAPPVATQSTGGASTNLLDLFGSSAPTNQQQPPLLLPQSQPAQMQFQFPIQSQQQQQPPSFQFPISQQPQAQPFTFPQQQPQVPQQNLFNGLNFGAPTQQPVQQQPTQQASLFSNMNLKGAQEQPPQQMVEDESKRDAWSMGKGLVNLGNLKESMALPVSKESTYSSSQPVYIKPQTNQGGASKFVPGVFMTPQQQQQQQYNQQQQYMAAAQQQQNQGFGFPSQGFGQQQQPGGQFTPNIPGFNINAGQQQNQQNQQKSGGAFGFINPSAF